MRTWALAWVLAGCAADSHTTSSATVVGRPSPSNVVTVSAAPVPPPTRPASRCETFPAGFRGTIFGLPVLARLAHQGDAVRGRYFYETIGVDIALKGTLAADGSLRRAEGPEANPSGQFAGTCDPPTGTLSGTWTSPSGKSAPFTLSPIAPTYPPIVATKHWRIKTAKLDFKETKLELFGLPTLEAERAMMGGAGLDPSPGPWFFTKDFFSEDGGSGEFGEAITRTDRELVTVARGGSSYMTGAAHPNNGLGEDWVTYDLRTGQAVRTRDVFARDPTALVVACAASRGDPFGGTEPDDAKNTWSGALHTSTFTLEPTGIEFYAVGFPHAWGNLDGSGPVLSYSVLLRDGYLRSDSPVARAWDGVVVAPAGAKACPPERASAWWRGP